MSIKRSLITLSTRNIKGIVGNFYATDELIQKEIRRVVKKHGRLMKDETYRRTPKDTHHMANSIRLHFSDNYSVYEVGWDEADFEESFYPIYVEFGTRYMSPRAPLSTAKGVVFPQFEAELRAVLRRAAKRRAR